MGKYEIGDTVIVRSDLKIGKKYHMFDVSKAQYIQNIYDTFVTDMNFLRGSKVTIAGFRDGKYLIKEDNGFNWTDEMFETLI